VVFFIASCIGFFSVYRLEKQSEYRNIYSIAQQFSNSISQPLKINNIEQIKHLLVDSFLINQTSWVHLTNKDGEMVASNRPSDFCHGHRGSIDVNFHGSFVGQIDFCPNEQHSLSIFDYLIAAFLLTLILSVIVCLFIIHSHKNIYSQAKNASDAEKVPKFVRYKMHNLKKPLDDILSEIKVFNSYEQLSFDVQRLLCFVSSTSEEIGFILNKIACLAGEVKLIFRESSLNEIIAAAYSKSSMRLEANGVNFDFHISHTKNIFSDPPFIQDSIFNIITNAIEAGAKNIYLETQQLTSFVLISISNDGPPLYSHDPFDINYTTKENGGLGLACVKDFVGKHKGDISWVNGCGRLTFNIKLPCTESIDSTKFIKNIDTLENKDFSDDKAPPEDKKFIVIIDDDQRHLLRWKSLYKNSEIEVYGFISPHSFEVALTEDSNLLKAECIVLDYIIGHRNIFEFGLIEALKSNLDFGFNYQKPIFLSTSEQEENIESSYLEKIDANIGKIPLNWDQIKNYIDNVVIQTKTPQPEKEET